MWSIYADHPLEFAKAHLPLAVTPREETILRRAAFDRRVGLSGRAIERGNLRQLEVAIMLWRLLTRQESDVIVGVGFLSAWCYLVDDIASMVCRGSGALQASLRISEGGVLVDGPYLGRVRPFCARRLDTLPEMRGTDGTLMVVNLNRFTTPQLMACLGKYHDATKVVLSTYA